MSSLKMFAVIAVAVLFAAQADAAAHGGSMDFTVEVDRVSEFFLPTTVGGSPALDGEQTTVIIASPQHSAVGNLS